MPTVEPTAKPVPNLPHGFDFTDPDIYARRGCRWRSSPSCAAPRRSGGTSSRSATRRVRRRRLLGGDQARGRQGGVAAQRRVLQPGERRDLPRYKDGMAREQIECSAVVMLNMDAPQHTRLRKIISRGFTPRAVERLRDELAERAAEHRRDRRRRGLRRLRRAGVVRAAAAGHRRAARRAAGGPRASSSDWSNEMIGDDDPEYADDDPWPSSIELIMYAMADGRRRRARTRATTSSPS